MSEQTTFSSEEQAILRLQRLGWEFVIGKKLLLIDKQFDPKKAPITAMNQSEAAAIAKLGMIDSIIIGSGWFRVYIKKHKAIGLGS